MRGNETDTDPAMTPHRFTHLRAIGAAAIVLLALQVRASIAPPFNVLVVTLDTTRADRLSPYGFMNVSLPSLERLAREGVVFDQATSVAPLTLPAHTSLFTGLLPPRHGVRGNVDPPLPEANTTLAEVLRAHGFRTGAFVGSTVLDPDRGLQQGFERYDGVDIIHLTGADGRQRRAGAVVDDALRWLDGVGGSPFFLWAHLYDAHRPYDPPEPYATVYGHDPYVGEIAYADSQLGRLLEGLERRGDFARTLIVVAGDHGESLGERGERDHGIFIYENVLRVPLIIRAPGVAPSRVGSVVRLTDVMPTILELLRLPAASETDGVSLAGLTQGLVRQLDLEAYAESLDPEHLGWSSLRALRAGRYKLIDTRRPELYDLWRDPFETTNIYARRPELAAMMTDRAAALADGGKHVSHRNRVAVSLDVRQRVAALGYVTAFRAHSPTDRSRLPDPKDMIHLLK
jgi:arylsulfatase A-like enzyme